MIPRGLPNFVFLFFVFTMVLATFFCFFGFTMVLAQFWWKLMVLQWFYLVFEWFPLVVYLFTLVVQWFPLVFSTHIYVFFCYIMGFLGSRLVSIGFVRNLARCHCSGPLLPPYHPLLRVIRRSGPRWPPLGLSFLLRASHSSLLPLLRVIRRSGPLWPPLGRSFPHILFSYA